MELLWTYTKDIISVKRIILIMRESFVFLGTTLFLIVRKPSTSRSSTCHPILQVSVPPPPHRPLYSCLLKDLAFEWEGRWTWPWPWLDLDLDLTLTSLLWLCKSSRSYAHWLHLHNKSREVNTHIKARSPPASISWVKTHNCKKTYCQGNLDYLWHCLSEDNYVQLLESKTRLNYLPEKQQGMLQRTYWPVLPSQQTHLKSQGPGVDAYWLGRLLDQRAFVLLQLLMIV